MSYGKIDQSFWTDDKIAGLESNPKLLALYFLSGPHRNLIGCARIPDQYIAADLGWTPYGAKEACAALVRIGFITRDYAGWTLINNLLRYDPLSNVNAAIGAERLARAVPRSSPVYKALFDRLQPHIDVFGRGIEAPSDPLRSPSEAPSNVVETPEPYLTSTRTIPEPKPCSTELSVISKTPFDNFWQLYPRKIGKGAARKAYAAAVRKAGPDEIDAGLAKFRAGLNGTDPKFIPHPATWLNAERWLDDPPPRKPTASDILNEMRDRALVEEAGDEQTRIS